MNYLIKNLEAGSRSINESKKLIFKAILEAL